MNVVDASRTWWAIVMSKDVEACCALLRGDPVEPGRLDMDWVECAAHFHLVRLDVYAIDLLHRRAELRALLKGGT
jgi:hypothetical protein